MSNTIKSLFTEKNIITGYDNFDNIDSMVLESSLSRIWGYIQSDKSFGIISPYRGYLSKNENLDRYNELKNIVYNDLKLGFIELKGGFKEGDFWVHEKSLFIPNISKKDLLNLGEKYEQYSVIYKDENEFLEISTEKDKIGIIINNFIKKGFDKNLQIDSELTKNLFSQIAKGSNRDKKFIFNIGDNYLLEVKPKSFNEVRNEHHTNIKQTTYIKLL